MFRRPLLALMTAVLLTGCGGTAPLAPASRSAESPLAQGVFKPVVAIDSLIAELLMDYDHNRDGAIALTLPDNFWKRLVTEDERVRREVSRRVERDPGTQRIVKTVYTVDTYTRRDMFYAADRDGDQRVTREELETLVRKFDTNGDGRLQSRSLWDWITRKPKLELNLFNQAYGERHVDHQRREFVNALEAAAFEQAVGRVRDEGAPAHEPLDMPIEETEAGRKAAAQ